MMKFYNSFENNLKLAKEIAETAFTMNKNFKEGSDFNYTMANAFIEAAKAVQEEAISIKRIDSTENLIAA